MIFDPKLAAEITTTAVIAAVQVREALKLTNEQRRLCIRNMFYYDAPRNLSEVLQVDLNPKCPHHEFQFEEPAGDKGKPGNVRSQRGATRVTSPEDDP